MRMKGRSAVGSISTVAPLGMAPRYRQSKPEIIVKSASAAPCTMIGLTVLRTSAAGHNPTRFHFMQHPRGCNTALGSIENQHAPH